MKGLRIGTGRVHALAFLPNGALLVDERAPPREHDRIGSHTIRPASRLAWWDWQTGQMVGTLKLRDVLYSPDLQADHPGMVGSLDSDPDQPACDVVFDPARPGVAAAVWAFPDREDDICLFDVPTGRPLDLMASPYEYPLRIAIDAQSSTMAAVLLYEVAGTKDVRVWRYGTGRRSARTVGRVGFDTSHKRGSVGALAVRNRCMAVAVGATVRASDWSADRVWFECIAGGPVTALLIDPDRLAVLAATEAGLEEIHGRKDQFDFPTAVAPVTGLTLLGRNRLLVGGYGGVEVWDLPQRTLLRRLDWGVGRITSVAASGDETIAAAGTADGHLVVWDLDG